MIPRARRLLLAVLQAGLRELEGGRQVRQFLDQDSRFQQSDFATHLFAMGKAARSMTAGAVAALGDRVLSGLVIHPAGVTEPVLPASLECLPGEHPVPGEGSFHAGERVLAYLDGLSPSEGLLVLLSGGGSALVEQPRPGLTREQVQAAHRWLLESGLGIQHMNRVRQAISATKGGALAARVPQASVQALALSDVPEEVPAALASGPFLPPLAGPLPPGLPDWLERAALQGQQDRPDTIPQIPHQILADARRAGEVLTEQLRGQGVSVALSEQRMTGEVQEVAADLAAHMPTAGQARIHWGETRLAIPARAGRGGRCQHLALEVARRLAGRSGWSLLAVGTDGQDGNGGDAGALVDGGTVRRGLDAGRDPDQALAEYDSGAFLEAAGDLVRTGPTGTNLNEVIVALGSGEAL